MVEQFLNILLYRRDNFLAPSLKKRLARQGAILDQFLNTFTWRQYFHWNIKAFSCIAKVTLNLLVKRLLIPTQRSGDELKPGIIGSTGGLYKFNQLLTITFNEAPGTP